MYKKNPTKPSSGKSTDFQENFGLGGCILVLCTMANGEMSFCYYILCLNPCLRFFKQTFFIGWRKEHQKG
jgi:hypothetical protein